MATAAGSARGAALLADARGERLLAWGELDDGRVVGLHGPGDPLARATGLPWDLVVRGAWSEEFLDLVVQHVPGGAAEQVRLRFDDPGQVPSVVRERVQWTVVASHPAEIVHSGRSDGIGDAQRPAFPGDRRGPLGRGLRPRGRRDGSGLARRGRRGAGRPPGATGRVTAAAASRVWAAASGVGILRAFDPP